jgi:hypothetical protein
MLKWLLGSYFDHNHNMFPLFLLFYSVVDVEVALVYCYGFSLLH